MNIITEIERKINAEIRDIYNSGNGLESVKRSIEFLEEYPESVLAKYCYAVMHGDYSYDPTHSQEEKDRLVKIARLGMEQLISSNEFEEQEYKFKYGIRNEYFWFFEMHHEQYELGLVGVKDGELRAHYSSCVGASMLAMKAILAGDIDEGEAWATRSLNHFELYEKVDPDWYNINYFSGQSLACLERYEDALDSFKGMYRKQGAPDNDEQINEFITLMDKMKDSRRKEHEEET